MSHYGTVITSSTALLFVVLLQDTSAYWENVVLLLLDSVYFLTFSHFDFVLFLLWIVGHALATLNMFSYAFTNNKPNKQNGSQEAWTTTSHHLVSPKLHVPPLSPPSPPLPPQEIING